MLRGAMISSANDGTDGHSASTGDELVVTEQVAAFLVRQRAAEIAEVLESFEQEATPGSGSDYKDASAQPNE
jgi:hypothetical protein